MKESTKHTIKGRNRTHYDDSNMNSYIPIKYRLKELKRYIMVIIE